MSISKSFTKNLISIFLAVITALSYFSFANLGKVVIEIKEPVTTESESIVYEVYNGNCLRLTGGEDFVLEIKQNDEWVKLEQVGAIAEIGVIVNPFFINTSVINLDYMFGKKLEAGTYRLYKRYVDIFGEKTASVVFEVTEK